MGRYSNKNKRHRSLRDKMMSRLIDMHTTGKGRSRRADKAAGIDSQYIYSTRTYETYKQQIRAFLAYLKENGIQCATLEDAKPHVNAWLQKSIEDGKSAWTLATMRSAAAKVFQCPGTDFLALPSRRTEDITRSRYHAVRDARISQKREKFYGDIVSAIGFRKSEMLHITGDSIIRNGNTYYVHITKGAKGGKSRYAPIMASGKELQAILDMFHAAGTEKVFKHLPDAFDCHHYRGIYAKRVYERAKRDEIPKEDRYHGRGTHKGMMLDKKALLTVSQCLGHNRIDTAIAHYLY